MKRIACLIVLLAFSAPASARDSYFTFRGHRVHISALRHCRSLSCIRLSIPGLGYGRHNRDRDTDVESTPDQVSPPAPGTAPAPAPVAPPAPAQASPVPAPAPTPAPVQLRPTPAPIQAQPAPVHSPQLPPVVAQVPMIATRTPVATAQGVPASTLADTEPLMRPSIAQPSVRQETTASTPNAAPSVGFEVPKPQPAPAPAASAEKVIATAPNKPAPAPVANTPAAAQPRKAAPQVASTSDDSDPVDTPLGDWQTDGKNGLVRIESCGASLCGYVLDTATLAKGETILVNMKPKSDITWSGNIFSRTSGNIYYGVITMKEPNTLRVEACALGKFLCSGNDWTRIGRDRSLREDKRVTSHSSASHS